MSTPAADTEKLNELLWHERQLLNKLLFAIEVETWIVASGRMHWLTHSDATVRNVAEQLRRTEILRAVMSDAVAIHVGLMPSASLGDLAARVREPWRSILLEQRLALRDAVGTVAESTAEVCRLLTGLSFHDCAAGDTVTFG